MIALEGTIQLKDLSLYLLNLICNSCQILHQFSEKAELCWKGKNNPVTEVDYLIQHFIVSKIKEKYGETSLAIVAEEDLTYQTCPQLKQNIENKLSVLENKQIVSEFPKIIDFQHQYIAKDLCIWIDPLDCTQGLINQRKHQVTILVGITYCGKPLCGLIGHPYKIMESDLHPHKKCSVYLPTVYFGSEELKLNAAFQYKIGQKVWQTRQGVTTDEQIQHHQLHRVTTIGYRKMSHRQQHVVKKLGLKVIRAGGAGYKCLKVINKEVGSLMFIDAKTSKWDTCAGQAIIRAMGGFTATQNLEEINYIPDKNYQNSSGFIFSLYNDLLCNINKIIS